MVRPGLINLDFADVETVMSSMGKAMMGTGEAEGENRALAATEIALNNPLIDDYSLKGAKGLLVNITGGEDLTLFEVDQAVNKIRAEVDPEAELIFGSIEDESLKGKIRVSIVATALDGHAPESKKVFNMVDRIHNRNPGYSEGLFPKNTHLENNTLNSIDGATALKLDEPLEEENNVQSSISVTPENIINEEVATGISIENASYIENSSDLDVKEESNKINTTEEEYTPQLFSNDTTTKNDESDLKESENENILQDEQLFNQDLNNSDEDDFEIPAFLRRQKF
tara:strand:- start:1 stop:852 length:852 start_codon:yes stop_codon:yes gene_type:complete